VWRNSRVFARDPKGRGFKSRPVHFHVTALVKLNGLVTCGLTACTPGSAPGPTLLNEYGRTSPCYSSYTWANPQCCSYWCQQWRTVVFCSTEWVPRLQLARTHISLNIFTSSSAALHRPPSVCLSNICLHSSHVKNVPDWESKFHQPHSELRP